MNYTANGPTALPLAISSWVWYEGTDALREGEAVCYNTDYGTATAKDARRTNHVERPSLTNNRAFAGVAARDYPASSTGQFIEIYVPGSRGVNIALGVDTVIGTGVLTFVAGAAGSHRGRFYSGKYLGRGSAIVPGKYTIASITSTTVLVLSASAVGATPGAALTCTGYAYTGNPKCQADLLEGDESAGVEFISPPNAGSAALPYMAGGVSYVCGGLALIADADVALAQGAFPGQKKAFICLGTLATSTFTLDLATAGVQLARTGDGALVALADVTGFDAAGDAWYGEFQGAKWHTKDVVGGATEA